MGLFYNAPEPTWGDTWWTKHWLHSWMCNRRDYMSQFINSYFLQLKWLSKEWWNTLPISLNYTFNFTTTHIPQYFTVNRRVLLGGQLLCIGHKVVHETITCQIDKPLTSLYVMFIAQKHHLQNGCRQLQTSKHHTLTTEHGTTKF